MKTLKIIAVVIVILFVAGLLRGHAPHTASPWHINESENPSIKQKVITVETTDSKEGAKSDSASASVSGVDLNVADKTLQARHLEDLKRFVQITQSVVPTRAERAELDKLLSDGNLLRRTFLMLTDAQVTKAELDNNQQLRIIGIDYLTRAVKWKDNPAHADVVQSLKNFIVLDNLGSIDDKATQKSFAGDKVEAYFALRANAPDVAKELRQGRDDARLTRLVRFAESQYRFNTNADAREKQSKN